MKYKLALKVQSGPAKVKGAVIGGYLTLSTDGKARADIRTVKLGAKSWAFTEGKVKDAGTWQLSGVTLSCAFDGKLGNAQLVASVTASGLNAVRVTGKATVPGIGTAEIVATGRGVLVGAVEPTPSPDPSAGRTAYEWDASKMVLAGVDRDWYSLDPEVVCHEAAKAGCTGISIEMVGNDTPRTAAQLTAKYNAYLAEARMRKLVTFVCVVNDWVKPSFYASEAAKMLAVVLAGGSEGVIAQPVGETHTDKGKAFEKSATAKLKAAGFKLCYNGNGGRPSNKGGMDYAAWHTSGTPSTAPRGYIEITDHGVSIRDIGYFNAAKVRKYAESAKSRGAGFGLYRYVGMGDNGSPKSLPVSASVESWRAMAAVYATATQPTPAPTTGDAIDLSRLKVEQGPKNRIGNLATIPVTKKLNKASIGGGKLVTTAPGISGWGGSIGVGLARHHIGWMLDAETFFHAHFDWQGDGQTVKTLNNVFAGYTGKKPSSGQRVYFCIVKNDGKERTNIVDGGAWP